jgi:choline monooxygenase
MQTHLEQLLDAFDDTLPLERARTIPSSWYFDAEVFDLERRKVFADTWQLAARADQLQKPGDFATLDVAGEPIVVVRDDDGALRAFYNVCRHRAAQVVTAPCGNASKLRCRYHGWSYDLQGRLRGVPEFAGVREFCKGDEGLVPVHVAAWGPMVFVHLGKSPTELLDSLAPLSEQSDVLGIDRLQFAGRREYEVGCNWKVYVDNYQDGGYHVNTVHPALAGALDYSEYRTTNFAGGSVQTSPLKPARDASVQAVRTGDQAWYWWLFPNLMLNFYEGVLDTNLVVPVAADRCKVIFDFYFADVSPERQAFIAESMAVADRVQNEDRGVCEDVQRGLGSRSFQTGRFSVRRESGEFHFHRLLARKLRHNGVE